uniref:Putative kazal domain protein n=1 Tax=Rhipicephalus microplus TaxID=6941 RepID=A0A6G5A6U4_RHIMP
MDKFSACFIFCVFFLLSHNWTPSSNVFVKSGRIIMGKGDCWRWDCSTNECYEKGCECPAGILQLFGIKNCR